MMLGQENIKKQESPVGLLDPEDAITMSLCNIGNYLLIVMA
jgi:hypothetical protein